jgi:hypothetical protein
MEPHHFYINRSARSVKIIIINQHIVKLTVKIMPRKVGLGKRRKGGRRKKIRRAKKGAGMKRTRARKGRRLTTPRKVGGIIPFLIPLLGALGAIGSAAGGAAGITRAVQSAQQAKKALAEATRHNKAIEAAVLTRKGTGLRLGPWSGEKWNPRKKKT